MTSTRKGVEPPREPGKLTDADKIARFEQWKPFIGISGTYEVNGSKLVMHAIVAKALWEMNSKTPLESELKLAGPNTIWLTPTAENATKFGLRMKMTRLE